MQGAEFGDMLHDNINDTISIVGDQNVQLKDMQTRKKMHDREMGLKEREFEVDRLLKMFKLQEMKEERSWWQRFRDAMAGGVAVGGM